MGCVRRRQVALAHRLIELLAGGSMALLFDPRGFQLQEVIEVELLLIQVVAELSLKLVGGATIAKVLTDDLRPLGEEVGRLRRAMHLLSVMQIDEVSIQLALVPQLVEIVGGEGNELFSDSLAPEGQKGDTYITMYRSNIDLIVSHLK